MLTDIKEVTLEYIIAFIAIVHALFNLYVMTIKPLGPWIHLPMNLLFASVLALLLYIRKTKGIWSRIFAIITILMAISSNLYMSLNYEQLLWRASNLLNADIVFGIFAIVATLVITQKTTGWALPIVALVSIGYVFLGQYFTGIFSHGGYPFQRIIYNLYGESGIYGLPLNVAATLVFLFCLFGAFLRVFAGGQVFIDLATGLAGKYRGGPAKVAILASSFFGSISGSSIANVAATGVFTIPIMKNNGYKPSFAASVEAVASTGGQIMPPIMGSAAFLVAESIGIPYSTVASKALVPALLFYFSVFVMVDLEAVKLGLKGLKKAELPNVKKILLEKWALLSPLVIMLVMLLVFKTSPVKAALWSMVATIVAPIIHKIKIHPKKILIALKEGAINCISIIAACATAGIVIAVLSLTGLGVKIGNMIIGLSGGNILLVLVFTMIVSIILGMGLPTPAAYVICASVVSSAMSQAGIQPILAHMFILYFSILAVITPPVALASYTAAGIAGANSNKVSLVSLKLGVLAFIVPYMFVLGPSLLLEGTPFEIFIAVGTALIGVLFIGFGLQGWFRGKLYIWQRGILIIAALLTLYQEIITDIIGIFIGVLMLVFSYYAKGKTPRVKAS